MAEDFQSLDPKQLHQQPLYFGAERLPSTARADAPRIGDSNLQSSSLWTCLSPFHDQTSTYVCVPCVMRPHGEARWRGVTSETTGLMSGSMPEVNSEMAPSPNWSDGNSWGGSAVLADGQLDVKGPSTDQNYTGQSDDSLYAPRGYPLDQGGKSPFTQGNGAQIQSPFMSYDVFRGHVSPQQAEYKTEVPPLSPFQRHVAPIPEGVPEVNRAKMPNYDGRGPEEWVCLEGDCRKTYRRSQDLKRHTRDKHQTPHECPFCDRKWTRAEKIREHLTTKHEDHFTEEELREARKLRGRNDTVRFVAKCGMPKVPQKQHPQCTEPSFILALSLVDNVSVEPQGMRLAKDDGDLAPIGQDVDSVWSL